MSSIFDFVKDQRTQYRAYTIEIADGYDYSQYQTLRTIELYHNSKFETGNKDSLGREKPFYNICKFRVNVATRATDIDTKDVKVSSQASNGYTQSFILSLKNRNWMKQSHFASFLNRMGATRAKYGGVLVKKTEQKGELCLHVMQWRNMITDQVDIRSGVKIERHYYTPAELQGMASAGWRNINDAIATAQKKQEATAGKSPSRENRTPGDYIEVFEVHGVLPNSFLTPKEGQQAASADSYSRQMHIVILDETDKEKTTGVSLFDGPEDEDPYKYLPYEEVDGRGLGVGVVEDLFEAQVWTNYSVKAKKDLLDLAGKIIFQTSDSSIAAKNVLTDIENGTILQTAPNSPITQVSNVPASLGGIAQLMDDWDTQAQNVTSTYPAILGQTPPHGTAFRLMAALSQEASALFEYRRQEAGIFVQEMYDDWILPFQVKQTQTDKELVADLDPDELQMLSDALANTEAVKFAKKRILSGNVVTQTDLETVKQSVRSASMKLRRRGFTNFADLFEDWAGFVEVDITGEQQDKQALLSTLFQLFGAIAQNPTLLQNPTLAKIFNQIVETAGVSPLFMQTNAQNSGQIAPPPQSDIPNPPAPPAPPQPSPITANAPAL
jgi:hypothetical protein